MPEPENQTPKPEDPDPGSFTLKGPVYRLGVELGDTANRGAKTEWGNLHHSSELLGLTGRLRKPPDCSCAYSGTPEMYTG